MEEEVKKAFRQKYYLNRKPKHNAYCVEYYKNNKPTISNRKKMGYREKTIQMAKIKITKRDLKGVSLNQLLDKHVGKVGTKKRDKFDYETDLHAMNYYFLGWLGKKFGMKKS